MKTGLQLMGLAVVLIVVSVAFNASGNEGAASNAGEVGAAGLVCAVIGAVLVARALMTRNDS